MTAPDITIYTRHSKGCRYEGDEAAKRCDCRKWFRWNVRGKRFRKPADTRSWAQAELGKRELEEVLAGKTAPAENDITAAVKIFLDDKRVQGVSEDVLGKYTRELARLVAFAESRKVYIVQGLTRELLTGYAATWAKQYPSTQTRSQVRVRTRGFLRYCYEAQWLPRVPTLPKITVDEVPTMPLSEEEYARLLQACYRLREPALRASAHTFFQLMRWTGLAISDSLLLPRSALKLVPGLGKYRVETKRQKTGVHVEVVIPDYLAESLLGLPNPGLGGRYFFWDGLSDIVKTWTKYVVPVVFKAAKIEKAGNMLSHRLRDTFACYYLEKGVPLESVSKMLGHESIKTTEKSYAKWVKGRQDRLDSVVMEAWS